MAMKDQIAEIKSRYHASEWEKLRKYVVDNNLIQECDCANDRIDETLCKINYNNPEEMKRILMEIIFV